MGNVLSYRCALRATAECQAESEARLRPISTPGNRGTP